MTCHCVVAAGANAAPPNNQAPIHPARSSAELILLLGHIPVTNSFPPDLVETLQGEAPAFVVEMSTAPNCVACADLWAKLGQFRGRYGWRVAVINHSTAMLRSGRLGLPWVGNPVLWVRPIGDDNRTIPVAIGTDHLSNLTRNIYLAVKMLTGVRPDVAVRGMARFTGIVTKTVHPRASVR